MKKRKTSFSKASNKQVEEQEVEEETLFDGQIDTQDPEEVEGQEELENKDEENDLDSHENEEEVDDEDDQFEQLLNVDSDEDDEEYQVENESELQDEDEDDQHIDENDNASYLEQEDSDSSDEELPNRVGNIPMWWYSDFDHIGYDIDGAKIIKSENSLAQKTPLERLIALADDPNFDRKLYDEVNDREVILTDEDLTLIKNVRKGKFPPGYNPYQEFVLTPYEDSIHPLSNKPEPKSRFVPSKWETKKINYLIKAMQRGWIKTDKEEREKAEEEKKKKKYMYDIWDEKLTEKEKEENEMLQKTKKAIEYLPPPQQRLPGHEQSYNPPEEYLPSEQQLQNIMKKPFEERPFITKKYDSLRKVPQYPRYMQELYERCLELYICPRAKTKKTRLEAKSLLPDLPKPSELRPFPTQLTLVYEGHKGRVRSISVHPTGHWLASVGDDQTVRVWEIETAICFRIYRTQHLPLEVKWNPNPELNLLSVIEENRVLLFAVNIGTDAQIQATRDLLKLNMPPSEEESSPADVAKWENIEHSEIAFYKALPPLSRPTLQIIHQKSLKTLCWHPKGTYLATVTVDQGAKAIVIHHVGNKQSQCPLKKNKGMVVTVAFHAAKSYFYVATQTYIKIYNLQKRKLIKKLITGSKYISSVSPHPGGDNVIMGGYDKKVSWFDLDLSTKPYKTLRNHTAAVRRVEVHGQYPLFVSCSDDCTLRVYHCSVYDDLNQNALIVPVKIFKNAHALVKSLGILDCTFHPHEPWLFSCGADKKIHLYT